MSPEGKMATAALLLLVLLPPQLVDRTKEPTAPTPQAEVSLDKRGDIFMARKMYREAIETYTQALVEQPDSYRLYNKMGIAHHHLRELPAAKANYRKAIKLNKQFAMAVNNLGAVFYAERNFKKAAKTYRKALKISPQAASIHSNLGMAYFRRRKFKKASQEFLTALQLDPMVFERRSRVGTMLQDRSVEDRAKYYYYMAKAYAAAGIYDRALLNLRRALEDGYKKRKRIPDEPVFEPLHEMPEFWALLGLGEQTAALNP
jgi:tetratricopeptide (TPR) repeat protein